MEVQKFHDIFNLEHKSLIITDSKLDSASIKSSLVVPVKEYPIDQLIYAVCRRVEKVEMVFFSETRKELTFYSTVLIENIDVSSLMDEEEKNKAEVYKEEAEKFKKKIEEICGAEKKVLEQQISLKDYLNSLIKSYEREMKYVKKIENRWHDILMKNYATREKGYKRVAFEKFEDGILSFKVYGKYDGYTTFLVPKDIEKTWAMKFDWYNETFYDIHDSEETLQIFSLLIHEIQSLYNYCSQKEKLFSLLSRKEISHIFYQEYEIKIIIKEKNKKINRISLSFLHDQLKVVEIIFYYLTKKNEEDILCKVKREVSTLIQNMVSYYNYALNVPNIILSSYLKNHMEEVLEKIVIDKEKL